MKHADCAALGIRPVTSVCPPTATQAEVEAAVAGLNADPSIDAFILQYPFPAGLDYDAAVLAVDPARTPTACTRSPLGKLVAAAPPLAAPPRHREAPRGPRRRPGRSARGHRRSGPTISRPLANLMTLKHGPRR